MVSAMTMSSLSAQDMPSPELAAKARLHAVTFDQLPGFADDDHLAAWTVLRKSCARLAEATPSIRVGQAPTPAFQAFCAIALTAAPTDARTARALIEHSFAPWRIEPVAGANPYDRGFLTGYYEPEVPGALTRSAAFAEPILSCPTTSLIHRQSTASRFCRCDRRSTKALWRRARSPSSTCAMASKLS